MIRRLQQPAQGESVITYVVIAIFIAVLVGVGVYSRKKTSTVNDFFLGGRDVGPWLSSFAYGTTYFSAVLFVGYAGSIGFGFGLSSLWIVAGNALLGTCLAWVVLAKRTRIMTVRLGAMTMPEFFAARFGSRYLKIVAALIIFIFLVPYSASVYTGLAYLFDTVLGLNYTVALWGMAILTAIYLVLGGYIAVARNDFIQGVVMIVGVIVMVAYILRAPAVGGLSAGLHKLHAMAPPATAVWPVWKLSPFGWNAFLQSPGVTLASLLILTSLGVWGLPQMVQKFYAIRDTKVVRPAIVISTLFAFLMTGGAYFTGAFSRLFPGIPELGAAKLVDQIMPTVITKALPEALVVIILLLVLSASMSTLAGLVMISGSAITVDLVKGEIRKDLSEQTGVLLLRILIIVFILASVVLAQQKWQIIVNLMALSWGLVAGCFLGPFVWGLYWKRVSQAAVWVNLVFSLAFMGGLGWHYASSKETVGYLPVLAAITMLASLVITPLVSLVSPPPAADVVARAFEDGGAAQLTTPVGEPRAEREFA